jgi:hypothetical protein
LKFAAMTAGAVLMLAVQARAQDAVQITVGNASGDPDSSVDLTVSMNTLVTGTECAGTQNDITFSGGVGAVVRIAAKGNGKPDCTVNPDIDKGGTSFAFQPSGCTGDACTGLRALVLALDNVCPICGTATTECPGVTACPADLYTCKVSIAAAAAGGDYPMTISNAGSSDPAGNALATAGVSGNVHVNGVTPPSQAIIHVGSTSGDPGQPDLSIDVSLEVPSAETQVAGTQNDITFSGGVGAAISIKAKGNGKPDCAVNETIDKGGTSFAFQPSGCTGELCTGVRALVLALDNVCPICGTATTECPGVQACPQVMYTCGISINSTAEGDHDYDLTCSNAGASDPAGNALTTSCTDGKVHVGGVIITPTETPTNTPVVTPPTSTATATNTPIPTNTSKPTNTPGGHKGNDDDGCAIVSPIDSHGGWMLLLPAAALLWLRRRSR